MILNDFREKIERNNSELVELLMLKDELTNEQESMLIGKDNNLFVAVGNGSTPPPLPPVGGAAHAQG